MPRRLRSNRGLSAEQAHQALSVLVHDGKIRAAEVWKALQRREHLVREMRERLAVLERGVSRAISGDVRGPRRAGRTDGAKRVRRKPVSVARKAAMKAQGRYLAAVRPLSKANRVKVKAIRGKAGMRAAIAAAKRMAK